MHSRFLPPRPLYALTLAALAALALTATSGCRSDIGCLGGDDGECLPKSACGALSYECADGALSMQILTDASLRPPGLNAQAAAGDVLLSNSRITVVLDAMACAAPVVATCFGGAREAVVDGQTGFIVNPYDTATFADRTSRLLSDPGLRRAMGSAGRQRLLDRFTIGRSAGIYLELMDALCRGSCDAVADRSRSVGQR